MSSVSPTLSDAMCWDILPSGYVLIARSTKPRTSGREMGVYGRITVALDPSGFSEPMAALVRRHEATVRPDGDRSSAKAKR
eukprot:scaffold36966_cov30-Tisochrysis_lutea.AAC.2